MYRILLAIAVSTALITHQCSSQTAKKQAGTTHHKVTCSGGCAKILLADSTNVGTPLVPVAPRDLVITFDPKSGPDRTGGWYTTDHPEIASIDETGKITAWYPGDALICQNKPQQKCWHAHVAHKKSMPKN